MKQFLTAVGVVLFGTITSLYGCSAIDAKRIENNVKKYASTVDQVCTAVELFDSVGAEFPGVDTCKKAMKAVDFVEGCDDALGLLEAVNCIAKYPASSDDFKTCAMNAGNWPEIARRVSAAVKK